MFKIVYQSIRTWSLRIQTILHWLHLWYVPSTVCKPSLLLSPHPKRPRLPKLQRTLPMLLQWPMFCPMLRATVTATRKTQATWEMPLHIATFFAALPHPWFTSKRRIPQWLDFAMAALDARLVTEHKSNGPMQTLTAPSESLNFLRCSECSTCETVDLVVKTFRAEEQKTLLNLWTSETIWHLDLH